ncbi:hypothetical protein LTR22_023342 [Elasticomyces elasticus]|nr:hypothetical protein LTR22_023342 [Elasticomyces elasticus]KAK4906846.1 hypothetical protein LTR49_024052 [Elasticomyces elasticus]KAK4964441.1 hypothetical protein LTR42_012908 [Elasticomyces elasticus]KAK5728731.1 hypothetical protein LTR15_001870 [Elasticomyces elasticus]
MSQIFASVQALPNLFAARGVFDLTTFKHKDVFDFSEVEEMSKQAHTFFKNPKFRPSEGNRLVGFAPDAPFYGV